jgi:predicted alpha/beta superfamily hydrolase
VIAAALALALAPAAAGPQPIRLGTSYQLRSPSLGDIRTVNVVLPAGYARAPKRRWPVVYLIDGGIDQDLLHVAGTVQLGGIWGRSQEAIVVGIETRDRRRELTGPTRDPALLRKYPTAGHSAELRAFLRDTVKPMVAREYRTNKHDMVIGESLAGLFVVETWLTEPSLFEGYGAISPSLWWDQEALSKAAVGRIGSRQAGHPLYLATTNEGADMQVPVERLVGALGAAKGWCYAPRSDLTHATIYHSVSPSALAFLLPPASKPDPQFGFDVACAAKR